MGKYQHDCAEAHKYDCARNRSEVEFGTVWQCPTCADFWYRDTERVGGVASLSAASREGKLLDGWRRLSYWQTRRFRSMTKRGLSKRRIDFAMRWEPSHAQLAFEISGEILELTAQERGLQQNPEDWKL